MLDRSALKIQGEFQGILGLGVPKDKKAASLLEQEPVIVPLSDPRVRSIICAVVPEAAFCRGGAGQSQSQGDYSPHQHIPIHSPHRQGGDGGAIPTHSYASKLFLKQASVDRFSMCFRDGNRSGALRLNLPPLAKPIANIGTFHWGVDFRGMSVGQYATNAPAETIFCGAETMQPGMKTPCGIIPDSGTTLIMGPAKQILLLEKELCRKWKRCDDFASGNPSSKVFREMLFNCSDWLNDDKGLHELPSIFFHVGDANGGSQGFELSAWAWVTEQQVIGDKRTKVCSSGFGPSEYITKTNGPVWIFGTPLFYEYEVAYDMTTKHIALTRGMCDGCSSDSSKMELLDSDRYKFPRASHGEPRIPYLDVSLPL
jgi:hypothetical protein